MRKGERAWKPQKCAAHNKLRQIDTDGLAKDKISLHNALCFLQSSSMTFSRVTFLRVYVYNEKTTNSLYLQVVQICFFNSVCSMHWPFLLYNFQCPSFSSALTLMQYNGQCIQQAGLQNLSQLSVERTIYASFCCKTF